MPELDRDTIESIKVLGVFRTSDAVKAALAGRILSQVLNDTARINQFFLPTRLT